MVSKKFSSGPKGKGVTRRSFLTRIGLSAAGFAGIPLFSWLSRVVAHGADRAQGKHRGLLQWGQDRACVGDQVVLRGGDTINAPSDSLRLCIRSGSPTGPLVQTMPVPNPMGPGWEAQINVPCPCPEGGPLPGLHPLVATIERAGKGGPLMAISSAPLEVLVQPPLFGL